MARLRIEVELETDSSSVDIDCEYMTKRWNETDSGRHRFYVEELLAAIDRLLSGFDRVVNEFNPQFTVAVVPSLEKDDEEGLRLRPEDEANA